MTSEDAVNLALNPRKAFCDDESHLLTKLIKSDNLTQSDFQVRFLKCPRDLDVFRERTHFVYHEFFFELIVYY